MVNACTISALTKALHMHCADIWASSAGGVRGPYGVAWYMYTQKYTDQVKWVLTTLHTQWFTLTCDHKTRMTLYCDHIIYVTVCYNMCVIVRLWVDMGHRMCKTTLVVS